MIGSHKGGTTPVKRQRFQVKSCIEINVIEMQEGQNAGIGAGAAEMGADVSALKVRFEEARCKAPGPLVEIAEDDACYRELTVGKDSEVDELSSLKAAFEERGAQVNVEDMQDAAVLEVDVGLQAAAAFAAARRNIVVLRIVNRITGKKDIAVSPAFMAAILPHFSMVPEFLGYIAGLLMLAAFALDANDFLQRDDVSVQFTQDLRDAIGADAPIKAAALMDIVSGDAHAPRGVCSS
jgi:hypothetical protein